MGAEARYRVCFAVISSRSVACLFIANVTLTGPARPQHVCDCRVLRPARGPVCLSTRLTVSVWVTSTFWLSRSVLLEHARAHARERVLAAGERPGTASALSGARRPGVPRAAAPSRHLRHVLNSVARRLFTVRGATWPLYEHRFRFGRRERGLGLCITDEPPGDGCAALASEDRHRRVAREGAWAKWR